MRDQHQFARWRHPLPGGNLQAMRRAARRDIQPMRHATAGGTAEIGLTRQELLLITDQIAGRKKAAIEVAWSLATRVFDQHPGIP